MSAFTGFTPPTSNWSKLPHAMIEALPQIETIGEMKVILYVLRHTWGYHDTEKKITLDEFANGRKRRDGSRLDNGTGLSINTIKDGIERAVKHGFIVYEEDVRDKARIKRYYRLKEASESDSQKLTPRVSEVDPLPSEVDPRSEKETLERTQGKKLAPPQILDEEKEHHEDEPRPDVLDLAIKTVEARAKPGAFSTVAEDSPEEADLFEFEPLLAICETMKIDPHVMGRSKKTQWTQALRKFMRNEEATPASLSAAIRKLPTSEFSWKTYSTPYQDSFQDDVSKILLQDRSNGTASKNGRPLIKVVW